MSGEAIDPALPEAYLKALDGDVCLMQRGSGVMVLGLGQPFYLRDLEQALIARFGISAELMDIALTAFDETVRAHDRRQAEFWRAQRRERVPSWLNRWREPTNRIRF